MLEHVKCETPDLAKANLEKLKALFPGAVTEGPNGVSIDVEALKQECSATPIEGNVERYEFTWPGKRAAKAAASAASTKTLRPCREESVDFDKTENLYIEGDNLEVLKLLQKNYANQVKMIYIDPPYNTGHDFVYRDRFSLTDKELAAEAGSYDDEGNRFERNESSEARYHSNWCSMIYPRLKLARNLLSQEGVIFISIDDNEVVNLRRISDEIFGEQNFLATIVWQKKYAATNDSKGFSTTHDYIVAYRKSELFDRNLLPRTDEQNAPYKNDDGDGKGLWRSDNLLVKSFSQSCVYPILNPNTGKEYFPPAGSCWRASMDTMAQWLSENRIFFGKDGKGAPQLKRYLNEVQQGRVPITWWTFDEVGHNDEANKEIKELFGSKPPFDTPKPVRLIKQLLRIGTDKNALILDFFSGSATTAHSTIQLNAEDGGARKFIMVQLPEVCAEDSEAMKTGYKNICEIGKERIRRAVKKLAEELAEKRKKQEKNGDLFDSEKIEGNSASPLDVGFRVLKLDSSSLNDTSATVSESVLKFANFDGIKSDRSSEDLLFQMLLETHIPLSDKIERKTVCGNEVFFVSDTALLACLDAKAKMTTEFFIEIAKLKPGIAFFRDDAFADDSARTNLQQAFDQFSPSTAIKVI